MLVSIGKTFHEQSKIILKSASIDDKMIPVVKWLNSFPQVYTYSSCESGGEIPPFVAWFSLDPIETIRIFEIFSCRENTTVKFYSRMGSIVYRTTWPSIEYLESRMEMYKAYN